MVAQSLSLRGRIWMWLTIALVVVSVVLGCFASVLVAGLGPKLDAMSHGVQYDEHNGCLAAEIASFRVWREGVRLWVTLACAGGWRPRPDLVYHTIPTDYLTSVGPVWPRPSHKLNRVLGIDLVIARGEHYRVVASDRRRDYGLAYLDSTTDIVSRDFAELHLAIHPRFLYLCAALLTLPLVIIVRGPLRRHRRVARGLCIKCGYDLTGNVSGACSECGTPCESPSASLDCDGST